jgi:hypothetical protein
MLKGVMAATPGRVRDLRGRGIGYSYQKVAYVRRNAMKSCISDAFPMESEGFPRLGSE